MGTAPNGVLDGPYGGAVSRAGPAAGRPWPAGPALGGSRSSGSAVPVSRLHITVGYRVPAGRSFALDSFPAEQCKAVTDHFDFENLMPGPLMRHVVECVNTGRRC